MLRNNRMNDLTKEELQKICNALEVWAEDDPYLFMPAMRDR
jgi:DNA-binding Xre family transcriptional regulator